MTKEQALSVIRPIFRSVFKSPSLFVEFHTSMDDIEDWDSLTHVVLIDSIEKHLGIKFELRDMLDMENIGDICNSIVAKSKNE
jgi:acyl carrier protein